MKCVYLMVSVTKLEQQIVLLAEFQIMKMGGEGLYECSKENTHCR